MGNTGNRSGPSGPVEAGSRSTAFLGPGRETPVQRLVARSGTRPAVGRAPCPGSRSLGGRDPRLWLPRDHGALVQRLRRQGIVDLFAARDDVRAVFLGEAKSEWGSLEETLRRQDVKHRLAPKLAGCIRVVSGCDSERLVFPDESTARRVADRYRAALSGYPARSLKIRRWLKRPDGNLAGIWFLSDAGLDRRQNSNPG